MPSRARSAALTLLAVAAATALSAARPAPPWSVSLRRVGPVYIGAGLREGARLAGRRLVGMDGRAADPRAGCAYVRPEGGPEGVSFMVRDGVIARADVRRPTAVTLSGARVGDTEESVRALYGDRLRVTPHKYVQGGRYLVYVPRDPRQKEFRLVFETDGERVTEMRVGRLPEVEWVERCG